MLDKAYEPQKYEDEIYKRWEESGFFNPDVCVEKGVTEANAQPFLIVLPPPNVTGTLHMGHAAMLAIEDMMVRYHRMKGDRTLWVPGTDHAAVATESKVEGLLIKDEGFTKPKEELGREKFLERVKQFAQDSHDTIVNQSKKMGSSMDWSREAYTLDEERNLAVRTVFKDMYDAGLIYRGYRVVNWSVKGQSTCSDDELVHVERPGKLYYFKYSKDFPISIATTRPETKLGDTAVAVHPDGKWKDFIGKEFTVENFGQKGHELKIKIIGDVNVDDSFGVGALGVTTAHSPIDFEMYLRQKALGNDIGLIQVIGEDGKMTANAGSEYVGLSIEEARTKVVQWLSNEGLLEKEEDTIQNVGTSDRFKDVVEPLPKTQWFIDVNKKVAGRGLFAGRELSLKEMMQEVVRNNTIEIVPDRFTKTYFHWIDNLRDWCISRQIWFGHQIPVWYKRPNKPLKITFFRHGESDQNKQEIIQDNDTNLTDLGREQAAKIAEQYDFSQATAVYTSDLARVKQSAEVALKGVWDGEVAVDERLREINFGDLKSKSISELNSYRVAGFPGGETYAQVANRVRAFLSDLIDAHPNGGEIVIIASSGTRKVLDHILAGKALDYTHLTSSTKHAEAYTYTLSELVESNEKNVKGEGWTQDPDSLDTWFSAGLWTFSALGWPKNLEDFKRFHPTSVLETGYDILFFWVARMILMTTYTLGEVPFKTVYLHGLVRDEQGRKMSKSLGNIIDPLDMIAKYGTDATRLSLLLGSTPGNDVKLSEEKIAGFRNFTNKLWNISRFVIGGLKIDVKNWDSTKLPEAKTLADRWILARLHETIASVSENIEKNNFSFAGETLREFAWTDFADWYLEIAKIESEKDEVLLYVLTNLLKLWHPYMPFVTEAIWQEMFGVEKMIMVEKWPRLETVSMVPEFALIQNIVVGIRALRNENKIEPAKMVTVLISAGNQKDLLTENSDVLKGLVRAEEIVIENTLEKPSTAVGFVETDVQVYVDLAGLVDKYKEKARLEKEIATVAPYVEAMNKKLSNTEFVNNAPPQVIDGERKKLADAVAKLTALTAQLNSLT